MSTCVVATTNRDLHEWIQAGRFRADLFHRINVVHLHLPPLRDRPEDMPALIEHFMHRFRGESRADATRVSEKALQHLMRYTWPGNVRQLRNVIHHACIAASKSEIQVADLPPLEGTIHTSVPPSFLRMSLSEIERQVILASLRHHQGRRADVAQALGITTRTLSTKLRNYRERGLATC